MGISLNQLSNAMKIVKNYVDNKQTRISTEEGNAITNKEGGLFVEDKATELETLTDKVDEIKKYQKYVNTDLEYMTFYTQHKISVTGAANSAEELSAPYYPTYNKYEGNMQYDTDNNYITLKAGKTYQITSSVRLSVSSIYATFRLLNIETNEWISEAFMVVNNLDNQNTQPTKNAMSTIVSVDKDTKVMLAMTNLQGIINNNYIAVDLSIQEINRQTIIDPIEHANEKYGIEDTPVGHIISHMGTLAPKHYLICDGTEYNIIDYPHLAQHFIDQFGTVNYFGGDGTTTFCVPDLRGEFLRGTGTALRNTGSGAEVGEHQDATNIQNPIATSSSNTFAYVPVPESTQQISSSNLQPDSIKVTVDKGYFKIGETITPNTWNAITSYTTRPTNTSVLYCIKYEPTYYIQNYATKFQETTLWEGVTSYSLATSGATTFDNLFLLADSINSYDKVEIKYRSRIKSTGLVGEVYSTQIDTSDIDFNTHSDRMIIWFSRQKIHQIHLNFADEYTLKSVGVTNEATNSDFTLEIYKVIGLKPAKPVYDVAINCDNDYSTEERVIGRWVDGKPLYQKTIVTNIAITKNTINATVTEDSSNWETIMIDGDHSIIGRDTVVDAWMIPFTNGCNLNETISMTFSKGTTSTIGIRAGSGYPSGMILKCITLQYTKTTDSVETTTRKSYSLDETLTGDTWIDGKPIYRKVISTTVLKVGSTGFTLPWEIKHDKIVRFDGLIKYDGAYIPVNYYYATTNTGMAFITANTINVIIMNSAYLNAPLNFVIEYTKSE